MQNRFSKKFFAILFFFSISFSAQIIAQQASAEITDIGFNEIQIDSNLKAKNLEEDFVRAKLEENFQTYTSIRIYDVKNENKILDFQKTNATDFLGQLETSSHIANAVITSSANTASISLKIINIATNAIQSSVTVSVPTSNLYDTEKLTNALGELSAKSMQQLGIPLTDAQVQILSGHKSNEDITSKELEAIIDGQKKQLEAMKAKIQKMKSAPDSSDEKRELASLQSQYERLEKKNELEQIKLERKIQDEQRLAEEKIKAQKRSASQNALIERQKKEYEQKAKQLRKINQKSMDSYSQIEGIEQNKQIIISMRNQRDRSIADFTREIRKNVNQDCEAIDKKPYSVIEKDAKENPLKSAIKERENEKQRIRSEGEAKIKEYTEKATSDEATNEKFIRNEINKQNDILRIQREISSLDMPQMLRIGNFDGEKFAWEATISLDFADYNVKNYNILIPYKSLTGKAPNVKSAKYLETVEEYDSFFRSNISVLYAVVTYLVEPAESFLPSQYNVKILKTEIFNIDTNKAIVKDVQKDFVVTLKFVPTSDIRTTKEISDDNKKLEQQARKDFQRQQKQLNKENAKIAKKEENQEKITEWKNNFDTKKFLSPARHCGGSAGIQYDFKNMGVYASADFPLWLMFWGVELDVAKSKNAAQDAKLMKSLDFNTGIRLGMQFTWFEQWLSPYFAVTAGMSYDSPVKQFGWYVGGDVTLHTLAIADLFYRYRYNFTEKQSENMIGVALAINGPWKGNKKSQKK